MDDRIKGSKQKCHYWGKNEKSQLACYRIKENKESKES
jgi:hypothetical protein